MLLPYVFARVKESHDFLDILSYPSDVRPFECIAVQTAVGQILQNSRSAMLLSNDMINLEGQRCTSVGQMAVLTEATGPLSDLLLQRARDRHDDSRGNLLECQASLRMQQVQKMSHQKIALEFLLLSLS
jgi:hypothetical protein